MAEKTKEPGTSVAVTPQKRLLETLGKAQKSIAEVLPKHLKPERMLRLTMLVANKTPKLLECDPLDVLAAVVQASQLGLEIGSHAHLVPFNSQGKMQVVMIPDYRGIVSLARQSGAVDSIDARVVYKGEHFDVQYGTAPKITHAPVFDVDRSDVSVVAVYMVAHLKGEALPKFEVMTKAEVDAIKNRSRAKDNGPWKTDYQEMAKKTVIKRGCKLLPQSPELIAALEYDNRLETGEIGNVSDLLDTPEQVADHVRRSTAARAEQLKEKMGLTPAAPEGETEEERVRREDAEEARR